ncbi:MAG: cytidylate kinase-like family protein [Verrucomicrobiales bacterium]|nr:cytidylate kinase-like family protein [Verrucomicrobiales bacterium]
MNDSATIQRCLAYVETQLSPSRAGRRSGCPLCVTLSRQSGSGGTAIARLLASYLDVHHPSGGPRWTIFDKALVERVLREHNLPAKFAQYMPEDRVSYVQDTIEELFGLHPSTTELVSQVSQTILGLAEMGHCILIGRAANVILARSPGAFHVRIISPFERRVERVMRDLDLAQGAAMEFINHEDAARARYVRTHFEADVANPMAYDLVVNSGTLTETQAARLIGEAVIMHAESVPATTPAPHHTVAHEPVPS